ncbi:MAG: IS66 family transposase zinc-finger binding domain-containing protein [Terriglobia bacterium]
MPSRETLLESLAALSRQELVERVVDLETRLIEAQAQIAELRRQLFGPKAEKLSSEEQTQMEALAEDLREKAQQPSPLIQEVLVEEHRRRRPRPPRHPLPPALETETVTLEPPPEAKLCPHCGSEKKRIGEEVSEEIDLIPAKLIRRRTVRPKYACRRGSQRGHRSVATPPDSAKHARAWTRRASRLGTLR